MNFQKLRLKISRITTQSEKIRLDSTRRPHNTGAFQLKLKI